MIMTKPEYRRSDYYQLTVVSYDEETHHHFRSCCWSLPVVGFTLLLDSHRYSMCSEVLSVKPQTGRRELIRASLGELVFGYV